MFITTANTLGGIPLPLQDRMEIIQLTSYTEFEKLNIAAEATWSRARGRSAVWTTWTLEITENAMRTVIHHYTQEAGVRSLEREIASDVPQGRAASVLEEGKDAEDRDPRRPTCPSTSACRSTASARREEDGPGRAHARPQRVRPRRRHPRLRSQRGRRARASS